MAPFRHQTLIATRDRFSEPYRYKLTLASTLTVVPDESPVKTAACSKPNAHVRAVTSEGQAAGRPDLAEIRQT